MGPNIFFYYSLLLILWLLNRAVRYFLHMTYIFLLFLPHWKCSLCFYCYSSSPYSHLLPSSAQFCPSHHQEPLPCLTGPEMVTAPLLLILGHHTALTSPTPTTCASVNGLSVDTPALNDAHLSESSVPGGTLTWFSAVAGSLYVFCITCFPCRHLSCQTVTWLIHSSQM